jgi:hypothetical protein
MRMTEAGSRTASGVRKMPEWLGPYGYEQRTCIKCGSANVDHGGMSTTLVGWIGGPDQDPNHKTQVCRCNACDFEWMREWVTRDRNAWATEVIRPVPRVNTDPRRIPEVPPHRHKYAIAGYPSCCESMYFVRCSCGAWAESQQRGRSVRWAGGVQTPPPIWDCSSCGYSSMEMPRVPV